MTEPKIIAEFPDCLPCLRAPGPLKRPGTLTQIAWRALKGPEDETPVASRREAIPLTDKSPAVIAATPMMPCLILEYDICAGCGIERVIRATMADLPIGIMNTMIDGQSGPGGHSQQRPPQGFGRG